MRVRVGPFTLVSEVEWPVLRSGHDDGLIVLDAAPGRERPAEGEVTAGGVWPVLVLRFFEEPLGRNVVSAAVREAFMPQAEVRPSALVLSYEAFETDSGLPGRRHHVVLDEQERPVHSVRWYVGHGRVVMELTLTVGEDVEDGLLAVCEAMARSVSAAPELGPTPELVIPPEMEDAWSQSVPAAGSAAVPVPESVHEGHRHFPRKAQPGLSEAEQDATWAQLRGARPAMVGRGMRPSGEVVCEMYPRGAQTYLVQRRVLADGSEEQDIQVRRVPTATAVVHALAVADLRADWPRQISAMGSGGAGPTDPRCEWSIAAGGEVAARIMAGPREHWRWEDDQGQVGAEWLAVEGSAPMALFPDEDGRVVLAGATTAARLYGHLSVAWAEVLESADPEAEDG